MISFFLMLALANMCWKLSISGDEHGTTVFWFGFDVSVPFDYVTKHVAYMAYRCVALVRDTVHFVDGNQIRFDSGTATNIIWGCSGIKQSFIWLMLLLAVPAGKGAPAYVTWLHKLWYLPVGWAICYLFNIFRLALMALIVEHHMDWFPFMHDYVLKYCFYGLLFFVWLIFVEKIRPNASKHS